jgi:hypothetical protein
MVRRVSTQSVQVVEPPPVPQIASVSHPSIAANTAESGNTQSWRVVSGAFQVTIPIVSDQELRDSAENTLAILKARLGAMANQYRWKPVVERLIDVVGGQVDGSGGNSGAVPPSFGGWPPKKEHCGDGHHHHCHHGNCDHHHCHGHGHDGKHH